jgi:RNA polymerase subunit RPABC4/transcription elongation factor Spt4
MRMSKLDCANCKRRIDATARLCPFCDADPRTGERIDTTTLLQKEFAGRPDLTAQENVLEFMRARQGVAITFGVMAAIALLWGLHAFISVRNRHAVSSAPSVPLTEVTDVSDPGTAARETPLPKMDFQYDGQPQTMRTFIVEPGAVAPPTETTGTQAAGPRLPAAPPPIPLPATAPPVQRP